MRVSLVSVMETLENDLRKLRRKLDPAELKLFVGEALRFLANGETV